MKSLDFMIVGAQKSGTTALAEFLSDHPKIEMANNKEAHVFDDESFCDSWTVDEINERYRPLFQESDDVLKGEATPVYLYFSEVFSRLSNYNPRLKLIVVLRDPVERAYSQYRMEAARGNESMPYWLALFLESYRLYRDRNFLGSDSSRRRHSYRDRGYYGRQLGQLLAVFPLEQVMVLRTEDLRQKHDDTMLRVFDFLGVEPGTVEPRDVFSQAGSIDEVPISSFVLRRCFRRDLSDLAKLVDIPVADWLV